MVVPRYISSSCGCSTPSRWGVDSRKMFPPAPIIDQAFWRILRKRNEPRTKSTPRIWYSDQAFSTPSFRSWASDGILKQLGCLLGSDPPWCQTWFRVLRSNNRVFIRRNLHRCRTRTQGDPTLLSLYAGAVLLRRFIMHAGSSKNGKVAGHPIPETMRVERLFY